MERFETIRVEVDLSRVRGNAVRIARETGVSVIAVVKADAYGLGAREVAAAIGDVVRGYYVFDAAEAVEYGLRGETIALLCKSPDVRDYLSAGIRPVVWDVERARAWAAARPVVCLDTGQQRFAADGETCERIVRDVPAVEEVFTHASKPQQAEAFGRVVDGLPRRCFAHAAGSSLLGEPAARFDAVRPGLALYRDAVRVTTRLLEVRESKGPVGYTGFTARRHGVVMGGYSNGLRKGLCRIGGEERRVVEVGMQTAFVELGGGERAGDEVMLLGDGVTVEQLAPLWGCTPQEALLRMAGSGVRRYLGP